MAPEDDTQDAPEAPRGPEPCMPCRGTGKVVSRLGGSPNEVSCPWCRGTGERLPAVDAQARWLEERGEQAPPHEPPAGDDAA